MCEYIPNVPHLMILPHAGLVLSLSRSNKEYSATRQQPLNYKFKNEKKFAPVVRRQRNRIVRFSFVFR